MNIGTYLVIIILIGICTFLIMKLYFIRKSIENIRTDTNEILKTDTNSLITISLSDKKVRKLANDINSELKNLRKEKLQYENGNQELKRTITNISHDMRTPLTAIRGYIDLIENNKDKEKQKEYINIIERKTNDLEYLTEQLFEFSKTMDIGTQIKKEECCINELLEITIANFYNTFKAKNIIPKINICEEKIYRHLDKGMIIRIFENILSNVIKYSNGSFNLSIDNTGIIVFSNKAETLDESTVKKIFDRYFTVENAKKSTGIGLSIAKQLVELNGGSILAKYIDKTLIIEIML